MFGSTSSYLGGKNKLKTQSVMMSYNKLWFITMTSQWAWRRLKSQASRLFTQLLIQRADQRNIRASRHWPLGGKITSFVRPFEPLKYWLFAGNMKFHFYFLLFFDTEVAELVATSGQWRGALIFSLICVWITAWANNCEAGNVRRHRGHDDYSVVMGLGQFISDGSWTYDDDRC